MLLRKQLEALELTYPDAATDSETGSVPSVTKVFQSDKDSVILLSTMNIVFYFHFESELYRHHRKK